MSEQFYNLMQEYRHAPLTPQDEVIQKYEAVISFIAEEIAMYRSQNAEDIAVWVEKRLRED